jgi:predicted HTH domain antitoxin
MQVNIDLPQDVTEALQEKWGDLPRRTLESVAIEGYRTGALTEGQIRRMLGFETRMEVHELLKKAGVPLDYGEADLAHDIATHRKLGII